MLFASFAVVSHGVIWTGFRDTSQQGADWWWSCRIVADVSKADFVMELLEAAFRFHLLESSTA